MGAQKLLPYQGMRFIPSASMNSLPGLHIKNAVKKLVSQELDPSRSFASQRVGAIRVVRNLVSLLYFRNFHQLITYILGFCKIS